MNLPNTLTIARIFFVPLLVAVLVQERIILHWNGAVITNDVVALIIFWVAAATDLLDGYLARRWGQVTTIGTLLDPIADKLLVSAALISLVQERVVAGWLVVLLVGREFAVSGLRSIAAVGRLHHQSQRTGKDEDSLAGAGDFAADDQHASRVGREMGAILALRRGVVFALVGGRVLQQVLAQGRYPHQAAAPPGIADRGTSREARCYCGTRGAKRCAKAGASG